jgi:hypothetical protein
MSEEMSNDYDTIRTLYRALLEPVSDVDSMSPEEIRVYLLSEGHDPASLHAALAKRVKELAGRVRLQRAAADYRSVATRMANVAVRLADAAGDRKELVLEKLSRLNSREPGLAAAMFRKFEEADEVDFKALYEDLIRLDELSDDEEDAG